MQTVLFTPNFERQASAAGLDDSELQEIAVTLAAAPFAGDLIRETGGLRKLRFARKGGGKSGGYRVVYYFAGDDIPIFALDLIDKSERANLSKAERNAVARQLPLLVADYRKTRRLR
jgi:hypothetical protein